MKLVPLSDVFRIEYGNQLNLNAMATDPNGVNFVSRSSQNLGVVDIVAKIPGTPPYEAGLITVTLGGTYLLSSFVQPNDFYTAQNIKVLKPKTTMSMPAKVFYCLCIAKNRFRYTSHGREANKSLDEMIVPTFESVPHWVNLHNTEFIDSSSFHNKQPNMDKNRYEYFKLQSLFTIERGRGARKSDVVANGSTPKPSSAASDVYKRQTQYRIHRLFLVPQQATKHG